MNGFDGSGNIGNKAVAAVSVTNTGAGNNALIVTAVGGNGGNIGFGGNAGDATASSFANVLGNLTVQGTLTVASAGRALALQQEEAAAATPRSPPTTPAPAAISRRIT
jgi:hypothetical protein